MEAGLIGQSGTTATNLVILGEEEGRDGAIIQFQNTMGKCAREILLRRSSATPLNVLVNFTPFLLTFYHTLFCDTVLHLLTEKSLSDCHCAYIFKFVAYCD